MKMKNKSLDIYEYVCKCPCGKDCGNYTCADAYEFLYSLQRIYTLKYVLYMFKMYESLGLNPVEKFLENHDKVKWQYHDGWWNNEV
ncbi:MAG TPA: hypothetical protein VK190_03590 [Pseudoneobacillus sp.]|nr:hypothetical protein [Pseudoneobacillus sp.]